MTKLRYNKKQYNGERVFYYSKTKISFENVRPSSLYMDITQSTFRSHLSNNILC